jgi:hypothetical protein
LAYCLALDVRAADFEAFFNAAMLGYVLVTDFFGHVLLLVENLGA